MKTVIITLTIIILTISKPIYSDENKICFYTEDKFKGDSICLAPNQKIDLYQDSATAVKSDSNLTPINNDSIQSITVPPEMTATIYKNDNYIPPFFELQENITNNSLKALGMSRMITSIKVSKKEGLNCDQQCVIINNHTIKLADVFDKYWNDARLKNKQILLVFNTIELGVDDNYEIVLFNGANININNSRVSFTNVKMNDGIYFERYQRSDNLSFIIQIDEDIVQVQYLQTLKNRLVNTSPIIFFDWDSHLNVAPEIIITNYNKHKPLVIAKTILTADTGDKDWEKRDLVQTSKILCAFTPFLNIYNYIIQGKCQQLDSIIFSANDFFNSNTKGKTLHIAGNSSPLLPASLQEEELTMPEKVDNYMTLAYMDYSQYRQSLSLPAAAKTCMVSIHSLLNARPARQIRPRCIEWTLDIMTDFTLLFGNSLETWNSAFFGRIIDSIIRTGSTGVAVENQAVENRFIHAITEKITDKTTNNAFGDIKTALDYAQLSYVTYSNFSLTDESPAQVELLPLGIYELLLETFIYRQTPPIIISHGELVEQTELEFEIEILPTPTPEEEEKLSDVEVSNAHAMRKKLRETVALWEQQYEQGYPAQGASADADPVEINNALTKLLHAGNIVTGIIKRRLILHRPGEIYVIVKFQGRVIAIVLADRFNSHNEVELVASATLPDYVLFPDREGTVRGAGTAAVRELSRYLQQQGARTLYSEVISQPSARVKQKVGFNFKGEF